MIGTLLVSSLKYFIARDRPYRTYPDVKKVRQFVKTDPSFPSFHTFISFLTIRFIPKKPKWPKYFSTVYLLILIPFWAMYMGLHYPSDVVVGALIGLLLPIVISEKIAYKLGRKF